MSCSPRALVLPLPPEPRLLHLSLLRDLLTSLPRTRPPASSCTTCIRPLRKLAGLLQPLRHPQLVRDRLACPRRRCCPPRAGAVPRGTSSTQRIPVTLRSTQLERLCNWSVRHPAGKFPPSRPSARLKPQPRRSTPAAPLDIPTHHLGLAMSPAGMAVVRWNRGSRRSIPEMPPCNLSAPLPTGRCRTDTGSKPPCHLGRRCTPAGKSRNRCY